MKPFFPVIRLLAFPIHEELRTTIESLHETKLNQRFDQRLEIVDQRIEKSEQRLDHLEGTLDERLKDLDKSIDYIRLLYNLDHNLVVELTKLKIEADTLKSKFRILEKDQEFLQKREKALEERAAK